MLPRHQYIGLIIKAAVEAGKATLRYYGKPAELSHKDDQSPLTLADLESNQIIESYLQTTQIPVISEESPLPDYRLRRKWEQVWLVDPLDGTREFIQKRQEFTINIALVEHGVPVMGAVYVPVQDVLYYAVKERGAYKVEKASAREVDKISEVALRLPFAKFGKKTIVVASKSHLNSETSDFIVNLSVKPEEMELQSYGSSLKLCKLAEGVAHIYPRMGTTMEWDTAAGHAILSEAGCELLSYPGYGTMLYNKADLKNPWFVAFHQSKRECMPD